VERKFLKRKLDSTDELDEIKLRTPWSC